MANKVTIDVEARFVDHVSDGADTASESIKEMGDKATRTQKILDKLSKKKPIFDADTNKLLKKIREAEEKAKKLGKNKTTVVLKAMDKATNVIGKALNKAQSFGGKMFTAILKVKDSNAVTTLKKVTSMGKELAGKTWTTLVKIKDMATAPLAKLRNSLFSIKTLVATITAGLAAKQFIVNPIGLADQYSSAKIGFSTLLGDSAGQQMMNQIDEFAKATPFKTSGVISNVQKMMAYGWDVDRVIDDMETIGDAAAATGKGDEGLESIVYALSEIRSKGKLSTQELNQLAGAGIKAKQYLAQGLGYGTDDAGLKKLAEDLEDGAIGANQAIDLILQGMKEFDGMMDRTANETVEGLKSQIEDTFEINVFRRWGQGLQDGAKRAFGSIVSLLDEADGALEEFGDTIYEVGKNISNWLATKMENAIKRITEITGSYEFKNASLGEKLSMLWKGVIADPLKEWWEGGGQEKTAKTAGKIGAWIGETLTKGLLAIFGATDILNDGIGSDAGSSIAGSFLQGFLDNFDGQAITDAFVDAISNVWNALPTWAKVLIGGYAGGKAISGIGNVVGGAMNLFGAGRGLIGSTGNAIVGGSGLLGGLANIGYGVAGHGAGAYFGAGLSGGMAALGGAGGIVGAVSAGKGLYDLYGSYRAYKSGDNIEAKAKAASGGTALGGVAAGAAIGSLLGPIGALVGAGVGGIAGWIGGNKWADSIRSARYESEEMKEAIKDTEISAEELAQTFDKAVYNNMKSHFGDIKLSLSEIERLTDQIVWGDDMGSFDKYNAAVKNAEANLQSLKSATENTERWMWKASLGVKFNEDERESIKASFDEYISAAKSYVENKHYEFTAGASLLIDLKSKEGKDYIASGDALYTKLKEQLDDLGGKLSNKVEIALKDGVITLNEQKEITNLQQQIAEITSKLANAEQKAELELIKLKFGKGNLDLESFETFMATMQTTINERIQANDDAFVAQVSSLNLQLEEGIINQEEYDKKLQTLIDGYTGKVEKLKAEVMDVELEIIGDTYAEELGKNAKEKLEKALNEALKTGIDPIKWSDEELAKLLGVDSLGPETAEAIKRMLSGVVSQIEVMEVDGKIYMSWDVEPDSNTDKKVKDAVDKAVPDNTSANTNVSVLSTWSVQQFSPTQGTFGVETAYGPYATNTSISPAFQTLHTFSPTMSTFGIRSSYTYRPTLNISPKVGSVSMPAWQKSLSGGSGYRGGIFGGNYAQGGIVDGSTKFIRVNEESPEMVIPLSSQRRGRALKLWAQAGNIMGVPGFARGGMTDGSQDEGLRFNSYGSDHSGGGQSVHVEVGGVSVQINVNANNSANIVEAIKEQGEEIAETVAGILADALSAQFENTPTRGDVA